MIVAIDGPAGSGKSTVARRLAERLGFHYLDTGAMYRAVAWLADGQELRAVLRERQRELGTQGNAVIEGRDIGTVVAPAAEVKVFLVADETVRARRRAGERPGANEAVLAQAIRERDASDAAQTVRADDAVELDTTELTIDEVVERIERLVRKAAA